jgi:isopropylmalate/homocitrate/citramalate synthase
MSFPKRVKIVEVSPRDGLQNEKKIIPTAVKIDLIHRLVETGLSSIEVTSFVSPIWVPQLADHREVFQGLKQKDNISYSALVPNLRGLQAAMDVGVKEIAVFTSPSQQFCQHNINCSVEESLDHIAKVVAVAKNKKLRIRGYLSCVLGCPYEGEMPAEKVAHLAELLFNLGCAEISLGDTIGVGTALKVQELLEKTAQKLPLDKLAVHFHDTYGQALVNIYAALESGISIIDSSVAGLGGCPYAKGAAGNVATEDLVYLLNGLGITNGVDLPNLIEVGRFISQFLDKLPQSRVNLASPASIKIN